MTKEEAIVTLKEMVAYEWETYQTKTARVYVEALNMAIKALEKDSVLDKIRAELTDESED